MAGMRSVRFILVMASVLVVSAIVGGIFAGHGVDPERLPERYRAFTTRCAWSNQLRREDGSDRVVYGAIAGMLQTLDRIRASSIPGRTGRLRDGSQGRYYGPRITSR